MKKLRVCISLLLLLALLTLAFASAQEQDTLPGGLSGSLIGGGIMTIRPPEVIKLSDTQTERLEELMADYEYKEDSLLINPAEHFYYYEHISPLARQIYDVIYDIARDPVEGNVGLLLTDLDPFNDTGFWTAYNAAYWALEWDRPELFWLHSGEAYIVPGYSYLINGTYYIYFYVEETFTAFEEQMRAFNAAADSFASQIDTTRGDYETVLQIHDRLCELVTYNTPSCSRGNDLSHTAYGAFVEDSIGVDNYPVCDGYSLAFEYICQRFGIEALVVPGFGGSDAYNGGGHAWNMVKLNGTWYEMDVTWDDNILDNMAEDFRTIEGWHANREMNDYTYECYVEAFTDSAYRDKLGHAYFLLSTDSISKFDAGDRFVYPAKGGREQLKYGPTSDVHIRDCDMYDADPDQNPNVTLSALLPIAPRDYAN